MANSNAALLPQRRYIFTVTAGRSDQASLANLSRQHVSDCYPEFEEPDVDRRLPGLLGDFGRRFRNALCGGPERTDPTEFRALLMGTPA